MAQNTTTIRRLPQQQRSADIEMATAAALFAGAEQTGLPALRWYWFSSPGLLLGSSQRLSDIDTKATAAQGISLHRRRSGGGAVLGDSRMLMCDLIIPNGHPLYRSDVTESYRWIGEVWVYTLGELGIESYAIPVEDARIDTAELDPLIKRICFGGQSPYEGMVGPRKLIGLAQSRRRGGALYQIGIPLDWSSADNAAVLAIEPEQRQWVTQQLDQRVTGLKQILGVNPGPQVVIETFERSLALKTGLEAYDDKWTEAEYQAYQNELPRYAPIHETN